MRISLFAFLVAMRFGQTVEAEPNDLDFRK